MEKDKTVKRKKEKEKKEVRGRDLSAEKMKFWFSFVSQ